MLNPKPKVIILYARFGDGHYQVANALKQQFAEQGIAEATLYDPFGDAYPAVNRWCQSIYYNCTSRYPKLYGWSYSWTNRIPSTSAIGEWLHSLGSDKLMRMLKEERPDAVIQTFPLLTMSYLRVHAGYRIPTYTVLTDYVLHSRWLHAETDRYFVATGEMKRQMEDVGIEADRITVSGIPIRDNFRAAVREEPSAEPASERSDRSILVMAGAYGVSAEVGETVDALLRQCGCSIQLVCGKNEKLRKRMDDLFADEPRVTVFGFVERIDRLMSRASCIVTKAGGITLSEAMALKLPVITYRPIPGQESGNAQYWAGKGMLTIAHRIEDIPEQAAEWLAKERTAGGTARGIAAVDAAERIAVSVLRDIEASPGSAYQTGYAPNKGKGLRAKLRMP